MDAIKRLLREYNLLSAAVVATLAFASLMGWLQLSNEQWGGMLGVVAAWLLVLRFVVTPTADPRLPIGTVVNGSTANAPTGVVVEMTLDEE